MAAFLRSHRRRAGLTLDALAERTGLTKSYLSKVERGLSQPSIASALKIAHALQTDVSELFSDNPDKSLMAVDRGRDRAAAAASADDVRYHPIAVELVGKAMQPFVVEPGHEPSSTHMEHRGDEFVFVHRGVVEVSLPGRTLTLAEGDSLYFDADTPHRLRSVSPERAEVLVVVYDSETPAAR